MSNIKNKLVLNRFAPRVIQPNVRQKLSLNLLNSTPPNTDPAIESLRVEATEDNQIIKIHHPIQTPRSELNDSKPLLNSISSTHFDLNAIHIFDVHPLLSEVSEDELLEIFTRKCQQCAQMCDFRSPDGAEELHSKEEMLKDLLEGVSSMKLVSKLTKTEYSIFYSFFMKNVFRQMPDPPPLWKYPSNVDFSSDRIEEISWPHMCLCYDIFYAFLSNRKFNSTLCKKKILKLIHGIVPLFRSPDLREREKLIKIFHGIYKYLTKFRAIIVQELSTSLFEYRASPIPVGCAEILKSLIPIIQGFKVPLHQENIDFFTNSILPLHSAPQIQFFHGALLATILAYLSKDQDLVINVFDYLSKFWPQTSPMKQILFLNEIGGLTINLNTKNSMQLCPVVSQLVAKSISDPNYCICEKALMLWECDDFMKLIHNNSQISFPILLPEIYKTAATHWCNDLRSLALNTMSLLKGCDIDTFNSFGFIFKQIESQKVMKQIELGSVWNQIVGNFCDDKKQKEILKSQIADLYVGIDLRATGTEAINDAMTSSRNKPVSNPISKKLRKTQVSESAKDSYSYMKNFPI